MRFFSRGFSLVELLIVVAIISVLAGIALPTYQKNTTRAKISELIGVLESLNHQIIVAYNAKGRMPETLEGVSGLGVDGDGGYGDYIIPNTTTHLHYDSGSNWVNKGAMVQLAISEEIGKAIPGFVESVDGDDGAANSIVMAFYEENGTLKIYCGRWNSTSGLYIPLEYLPSGCDSDNIEDTVTGN